LVLHGYLQIYARLEIFTATKIQGAVFWILTPCNDVVGYRRFGGPYCPYLHSKDAPSLNSLLPKDAGIMTLRNIGILPITTRCQNPENDVILRITLPLNLFLSILIYPHEGSGEHLL